MSGFLKLLKKKKELIPLITIVSLAATGATATGFYFLFNKTDIIINKTSNPEPWERVDPTKPQKLRTINQEWKPIEELQVLKNMQK